jgi:hypothetical protein
MVLAAPASCKPRSFVYANASPPRECSASRFALMPPQRSNPSAVPGQHVPVLPITLN